MTLNHPHVVLLHRHAVSTSLTLLTMLTTSIALVNAVTLAVAHTVVHTVVRAAMIVMMMIAVASVPLVIIAVMHILGIFSPHVHPTRWNHLTITSTNIDTLITVLPNLMSSKFGDANLMFTQN